MWRHRYAVGVIGYRGQLATLVMWLLAASPSGAQTPMMTGLQLESGLANFFTGDGRSVVVTVSEVSGRVVESQVRIVYRDAANRVVARRDGVLRRNQPVTFELPLEMDAARVQLRASITIVGSAGRQSAPVVVLEHVDPASYSIEQRFLCAPPASREGPVTPYCPDFAVSSFTVGG